jgi:hypothetical protein
MTTLFAFVAYAKAVGLSREEAAKLARLIREYRLPVDTDEAWQQLETATDRIRRERSHTD